MNEQPETGITPGGTSGAFRDVLSKDHARRGKPPLHFADMSDDERIAKAEEIGLPKFRVKQLANHYYGHFDIDAEEFSDFPAARRAARQDVCLLLRGDGQRRKRELCRCAYA